MDTRLSRGYQKLYVSFSHVPCLLPVYRARDRGFLNFGFGEPMFGIPVVFAISVMSAKAAINPLACGCLNCLHHFRRSRRFREKRRIAKHMFGKTYPDGPYPLN